MSFSNFPFFFNLNPITCRLAFQSFPVSQLIIRSYYKQLLLLDYSFTCVSFTVLFIILRIIWLLVFCRLSSCENLRSVLVNDFHFYYAFIFINYLNYLYCVSIFTFSSRTLLISHPYLVFFGRIYVYTCNIRLFLFFKYVCYITL